MDCCTNITNNESNTCPVVGFDKFNNNDIKEKGFGVYDPKSHICARYVLNDGFTDTPDNWCSYKILSSERFQGTGTPQDLPDNDFSFDNTEYITYINLLTSKKCEKWLRLDTNKIDRGFIDETLPYMISETNLNNVEKLNEYFNSKYRNKALGEKLSKFFMGR